MLFYLLFTAVALGIDYAIITPLCNFIFHCGCTSVWGFGFPWTLEHAASRCNHHAFMIFSPHCPMCTLSTTWIVGMLGILVIPQILLLARSLNRSAPLTGLVMSTGWFAVSFTVSGLVAALAAGYPHFILENIIHK